MQIRPAINHPATRFAVKVLIDALLAALAWISVNAAINPDLGPFESVFLAQWVIGTTIFAALFQLHRQHYRFSGPAEFLRVFKAMCLATAVLFLLGFVEIFHRRPVPYLSFLFSGFMTAAFWGIFRSGFAQMHEARNAALQHHLTAGSASTPTIIVGAGYGGFLIQQEILRHPELGYDVLGFVDDAPEKQGIKIKGMPVLGTTDDLPQLAKNLAIKQAIIAIPSATGQTIRDLTHALTGMKIAVKTVPGLFNLLGDQAWTPEIKDVAIEDLLRRAPVTLDQGALRDAIQDSVVLITGGGGSIGSELARQAAAFRPARIIILGRGENSLWESEMQLRVLFPNQTVTTELCDIRDKVRLAQAFERWRPDIVLHAAAHKHVPFLERFPCEAVSNNILGTRNVALQARDSGASIFVNISTDKAVNPTNVLGASKYIAECIVQEVALMAAPSSRYISVRFGNVLGSRGSVIPVFRDQIKRGGPITVTHADMTRYFMTIPEASQLVLQAGILGENGRIYALDMGQPVRINDLATDMARLSGLTVGQDIEIRYTGLRPGEKMFEELFHDDGHELSSVHPKIFVGPPASPTGTVKLEEGMAALTNALGLPTGTRQAEILAWLKRLVPTYTPSPSGLGKFERT